MVRRFIATPFLAIYAITSWDWPFNVALTILKLKEITDGTTYE